jgi:phosphotransferase system HPr-like phosphotransfer protein
MVEIQTQYKKVLDKYGNSFAAQYGWAAKDLKTYWTTKSIKDRRTSFKEIEKSVGADHLRGHYRMASHGIHANPKGILFSMASMFQTEMLLAGPSNAGLADAGHGTAVSLTSLSATLMTLAPTFDYQVAVQTMSLLTKEIGAAFFRAHNKLERDDSMFRTAELAFAESMNIYLKSKEQILKNRRRNRGRQRR